MSISSVRRAPRAGNVCDNGPCAGAFHGIGLGKAGQVVVDVRPPKLIGRPRVVFRSRVIRMIQATRRDVDAVRSRELSKGQGGAADAAECADCLRRCA
jgi:hypothetical protein